MCNPASFVVTKAKVFWLPKSDSHSEIIEHYNLSESGVRGVNVVPVEISPEGGNLSLPLDQWKFSIDHAGYDHDLPDWWDAERDEQRTRAALEDWAVKLTGWRLEEAFKPHDPFAQTATPMDPDEVKRLVADWASVGASVGASAWASVGASVRVSVWDSVWDSVRASVWDSVGASVRDSVGASVRASVWDSAWASARGYIGSLYPNITDWEHIDRPNPWESIRALWLSGRVPSFDGKIWRVHTKDGIEMEVDLA